jgi:hypothetical protein
MRSIEPKAAAKLAMWRGRTGHSFQNELLQALLEVVPVAGLFF